MKLIRISQDQLWFEHVDVQNVVHTFQFVDDFLCLVVSSPSGLDPTHHPFVHALCSPTFIESYTQPCIIYVARSNHEQNMEAFGDCTEADMHTLWAYLAEFEQRYF